MLYGLSGSSGTGKTTLAKQVAEEISITFMPTSTSACAEKHGFDPVGLMTLKDRLRLQNHLLEDHLSMLADAPRPLIVDRTPIDFIGYLMAEIDMHSHLRLSSGEIEAIDGYVVRCLNAAATNYDFIFMVGQLSTYEENGLRPVSNRAYQTHTQLVMQGAISMLVGRLNYATLNTEDFRARVDFVQDTITRRLNEIEHDRNSSPHIH